MRRSSGCANRVGEGAGDSSHALSGAIDAVDVRLEHNTLLVMWPPTQEEWRHEVAVPRMFCMFVASSWDTPQRV